MIRFPNGTSGKGESDRRITAKNSPYEPGDKAIRALALKWFATLQFEPVRQNERGAHQNLILEFHFWASAGTR